MKLKQEEIAEEVKDVFKEGDFIKKDITSVWEIGRLKSENYDWRIEFFRDGKKIKNYLPYLSINEFLEVYNLLLERDKLGFGLIYFSEIPRREI